MSSNINTLRKHAKLLFQRAGTEMETSESVYSITGNIETSEASQERITNAAANLNLKYELRKFQTDCVQALANGSSGNYQIYSR